MIAIAGHNTPKISRKSPKAKRYARAIVAPTGIFVIVCAPEPVRELSAVWRRQELTGCQSVAQNRFS